MQLRAAAPALASPRPAALARRAQLPVRAPSSAPITHSATGTSRAPRALQSVAHGGTRSSTQSVPAESVCTTRAARQARQRLERLGVVADRTRNSASSRPSGSAAHVDARGRRGARPAATARAVTAAITARRLADRRVPATVPASGVTRRLRAGVRHSVMVPAAQAAALERLADTADARGRDADAADAGHRQPVRDDDVRAAQAARRLRAPGPLRGRGGRHAAQGPRDRAVPRRPRSRATTSSSRSAATAPSTRSANGLAGSRHRARPACRAARRTSTAACSASRPTSSTPRSTCSASPTPGSRGRSTSRRVNDRWFTFSAGAGLDATRRRARRPPPAAQGALRPVVLRAGRRSRRSSRSTWSTRRTSSPTLAGRGDARASASSSRTPSPTPTSAAGRSRSRPARALDSGDLSGVVLEPRQRARPADDRLPAALQARAGRPPPAGARLRRPRRPARALRRRAPGARPGRRRLHRRRTRRRSSASPPAAAASWPEPVAQPPVGRDAVGVEDRLDRAQAR